MNILYLEDHVHFSKAVIKEFLSLHDVQVVRTVEEAIEFVDKGSFNLYLVDYDLENEKGDEFVAYVRKCGLEEPIIAVSSHEQGNNKLLEAGANTHCPKMEFRNIENIINCVNTSSKFT